MMKRRRFSRTRRVRPKMFWYTPFDCNQGDVTTGPLASGTTVYYPLVTVPDDGPFTGATALSSAATAPHVDRLTVHAIRGHISLVNFSAVATNFAAVRLGICTDRLTPNAGGAGQSGLPEMLATGVNPLSGAEWSRFGSRDWMWIEQKTVPPYSTAAGAICTGVDISVHVKSKRKLRQGDGLYLFIEPSPWDFAAAQAVHALVNLRTLLSENR